MRIEVDMDLCQGHAVCATEVPEVFAVPKNGQVQVLIPEPPDALIAAVNTAVEYCPTTALRLVVS
ncbi:MAG: ferredoxin [Acidimicrobiales bacterium]